MPPHEATGGDQRILICLIVRCWRERGLAIAAQLNQENARAFVSKFSIVTPPAEGIKLTTPDLGKIQLQNFILRFP